MSRDRIGAWLVPEALLVVAPAPPPGLCIRCLSPPTRFRSVPGSLEAGPWSRAGPTDGWWACRGLSTMRSLRHTLTGIPRACRGDLSGEVGCAARMQRARACGCTGPTPRDRNQAACDGPKGPFRTSTFQGDGCSSHFRACDVASAQPCFRGCRGRAFEVTVVAPPLMPWGVCRSWGWCTPWAPTLERHSPIVRIRWSVLTGPIRARICSA